MRSSAINLYLYININNIFNALIIKAKDLKRGKIFKKLSIKYSISLKFYKYYIV